MNEQTLNLLFEKVQAAHQKRVDKGLVPPIEYNEVAALEFVNHTIEEAVELRQEFSNRKAWKKHTPVNKSKALEEGADTLIMLIITLNYLDITAEELHEAVLTKLGVKRKDWIA